MASPDKTNPFILTVTGKPLKSQEVIRRNKVLKRQTITMITFVWKSAFMALVLSTLGSTAPVDLSELESQIIPKGRGEDGRHFDPQRNGYRDPVKFGGYPDRQRKPPARFGEEPKATRKEVPILVDREPIVKAETHPEYQWSIRGTSTPLPYPSEKAQEGLAPTLPPSSSTTTTGQPDTSSSSEEDEIPFPFTIVCSKYGQIPGLPLYPSLGYFPDPTLLPTRSPNPTAAPSPAQASGNGNSFSENIQGMANDLVKGFIEKQIHGHVPTDPPTVRPQSVQTFKGDGTVSDWNIQGVASDLVKNFVKKQIHDAIGRARRSVPENLDGASEFFPERKSVGIDSVNPKQTSKRSTKNLRKRRQIYPQLPTDLPNPSLFIYARKNEDNPPYNPYYRPGDYIYQRGQSTGNPLYQKNVMGNLSWIHPWLYRTTVKPTTTTKSSIFSWFGPHQTTTTTTTTTTPKPTTTTQSSIFSWFGGKTTTTTKKPMGWLNPRTGIVSTRPTTTTTTTTTTRPPALSISNGSSIGWAKHPKGYKPTPTTPNNAKKDKPAFGLLPWLIFQKLALLG